VRCPDSSSFFSNRCCQQPRTYFYLNCKTKQSLNFTNILVYKTKHHHQHLSSPPPPPPLFPFFTSFSENTTRPLPSNSLPHLFLFSIPVQQSPLALQHSSYTPPHSPSLATLLLQPWLTGVWKGESFLDL
jgi:hypothetical protein